MAIHEAGHAVLAYLLNRPFYLITLSRTTEMTELDLDGALVFRAGWMPPVAEMTPRARRRVEQMVLIFHAGRHTQELWYERIAHRPIHADITLSLGGRYDQNAAVALAARMIADANIDERTLCEAVLYVAALRTRMCDLVALAGDGYWLLVETLADALVEHTTLSWQQVLRILQRAARSGGVDLSVLATAYRFPSTCERSADGPQCGRQILTGAQELAGVERRR